MVTETPRAKRLFRIGLPSSSRIGPRTDGWITSLIRSDVACATYWLPVLTCRYQTLVASPSSSAATTRYRTNNRRREAGIIANHSFGCPLSARPPTDLPPASSTAAGEASRAWRSSVRSWAVAAARDDDRRCYARILAACACGRNGRSRRRGNRLRIDLFRAKHVH